MHLTRLAVVASLLSVALYLPFTARTEAASPMVAVGPQYGSTHVYVAPEDIE